MQNWPLRVMRILDHAERQFPTREIVSAWADGSITRTDWRSVIAQSRKLAQKLVRIGINRGDRVATLAMNHARHLVAWYGAVGMGGVVHTLNPRLFDDQLAYIANHAEDRVLLYDRAFKPLVERLQPQLSTIEHFICMEDELDSWIAGEDGDFAWVEGDETEPCGLCYTSGTTGNPKGVLYTHRSTTLHAMAEVAPDLFGLSTRSVVLPIVPMFHANAWGVPWAAPLSGCKLVLSADYRPAQLCDLYRDEGVTHSAGVPTVWLGMIEHVERTGAELGSLQHVTIGGSAAPRSMIDWFQRRGVMVGHAWGMTETSPIGTCGAPSADWDDKSAAEQVDYIARQGRGVFGVELRIVDDDGKELPRDGVASGRLQARGPWVVKRYFKEPADALDAEGWFDTGDVAILHPDGTMQITDRSKDVIKSGGEWISSIELENVAVGCAGVAEAAAIGIAHPKWDERPLLLVVRAADSEVGEDAIRDHLARHIPRWWQPDAIEFVADLPHTATGKLSKKTLRETYRDYRFANAEAMVGRD
ncbi:long-chain fatty acid--CoA ligase [Sphingomonas sp.]|uniref:long-chain fatty acid--CoA ligase n=1 Tax=Sphingomonas sp. TaxID=28214 RepID=UPI00286E82C9|nr:long-chain fatty acid--CoA ligase [Sphingomonas sp.]